MLFSRTEESPFEKRAGSGKFGGVRLWTFFVACVIIRKDNTAYRTKEGDEQ